MWVHLTTKVSFYFFVLKLDLMKWKKRGKGVHFASVNKKEY